MRKYVSFALFFLVLFSGVARADRRPANYSETDLKALWRPTSGNERKLVTSNSPHFWAWARNFADSFVREYAAVSGVVLGDMHPRNVFDYHGPKGSGIAVADIDDGGEAPLILDLVRYVTYLESSSLGTKVKEVFSAYERGLNGSRDEVPPLLRSALATTRVKIEADHRRYITKNLGTGSSLNTELLELTPEGRLSRDKQNFLKALKTEGSNRTGMSRVYGAGYKETDSGSSAGMMRFWVLYGNDAGPALLVEFKEQQRAATSYYQDQPEDERRVAQVVAAYSEQGFEPSRFGLVQAGGRSFWMRPRHIQSLDLGNGDSSSAEEKRIALYLANWLGFRHSLQSQGGRLKTLIARDSHGAKEAVERMVRAYQAEIEKLSR